MYSSSLAGSIIALSVGRTVAAGVAWAGVNVAGFDFGCDTTVCSSPMVFHITLIDCCCREHAISRRWFRHCISTMAKTGLAR